MAKRLRAKTGLSYPDAQSLAIVTEAGGMHSLTPKQRAKVTLKTVKAGQWCDDFPACSLAYRLERGHIEEVEVEAPKKSQSSKKGAK